ncbi:MAG: hypothetical protein IT582_02210 [Opitutaceae bacterium]|nr:hypothetical protein [Opitutaceae bacterium]
MTTLARRDLAQRLTPVVLAQFVGVLCGIIGVKLSSWLVPPEVLGDYGVFMSFTTVGMWVVHAGLIKYTSRHWAAEPDKPTLLRQVLRLWCAKARWLLIVVLAGAGAIFGLTGQAAWLVFPPLLVCAAALSLSMLGATALQVNREHWRDCGVSAVGSLTRTFLPLLFFLLIGVGGLYAGLTAHTLIGLALVAWVFRQYWRASANSPCAPVPSVYLGPTFTLLALADWALVGVNRWIVAGNFGSVETGFYTLAGNIAVIGPILVGAVLKQLFQPGLFTLGDRADPESLRVLRRRVDLLAAAFALLAIAGVLLLDLVMPWLVGPLVDQRYSAALHWIAPAGFFSTAVITGQFYHLLLLAVRREQDCARVDLTGAAVLIGGGIITASCGRHAFTLWLWWSPLLPWLLNRTLARRRCAGVKPTENDAAA